jgi:putative addiction module component (TIGR02574 family)
MTVQEIFAEARQLPKEQIGELVDRLLDDAVGLGDPEFDAAWRSETRRRIAEIQSGEVAGIPGEEVMAEIRKIVGL